MVPVVIGVVSQRVAKDELIAAAGDRGGDRFAAEEGLGPAIDVGVVGKAAGEDRFVTGYAVIAVAGDIGIVRDAAVVDVGEAAVGVGIVDGAAGLHKRPAVGLDGDAGAGDARPDGVVRVPAEYVHDLDVGLRKTESFSRTAGAEHFLLGEIGGVAAVIDGAAAAELVVVRLGREIGAAVNRKIGRLAVPAVRVIAVARCIETEQVHRRPAAVRVRAAEVLLPPRPPMRPIVPSLISCIIALMMVVSFAAVIGE